MADLTRRVARLRVPLGFLSAILVVALARPTGTTLLAGTPVALLGQLLRIWAAGHLNKSREVTSSGPYRWFAHPLYVGSSIMGLGLAIAAGGVPVALIIALYMGTTISAAVRSEEAFLRQKFGEEYDQYRRGLVGATDHAAASRRFSLAQALTNKEYRAVIGLGLAVLMLCGKAAYNGAFWVAVGTP